MAKSSFQYFQCYFQRDIFQQDGPKLEKIKTSPQKGIDKNKTKNYKKSQTKNKPKCPTFYEALLQNYYHPKIS